MNIYAIRDRLIDYYLQPFAGPDEKNVLAAIAAQVNGDIDSAINTAPHHFEVWELGKVDQEGHITPTRKLICDCSSLVRTGLRARPGRANSEDTREPPAGNPPEGPKNKN